MHYYTNRKICLQIPFYQIPWLVADDPPEKVADVRSNINCNVFAEWGIICTKFGTGGRGKQTSVELYKGAGCNNMLVCVRGTLKGKR